MNEDEDRQNHEKKNHVVPNEVEKVHGAMEFRLDRRPSGRVLDNNLFGNSPRGAVRFR